MLITINSISRLFLVQRLGFSSREYPCNLEHIPSILKDELELNDNFVIYEIDGVKIKKVSKTTLNRMFTSQKIDFQI
jgi:hypothetical protein